VVQPDFSRLTSLRDQQLLQRFAAAKKKFRPAPQWLIPFGRKIPGKIGSVK